MTTWKPQHLRPTVRKNNNRTAEKYNKTVHQLVINFYNSSLGAGDEIKYDAFSFWHVWMEGRLVPPKAIEIHLWQDPDALQDRFNHWINCYCESIILLVADDIDLYPRCKGRGRDNNLLENHWLRRADFSGHPLVLHTYQSKSPLFSRLCSNPVKNDGEVSLGARVAE